MKLDDQLNECVQQHKQNRENVLAEISALKRKIQFPLQTITPQKIEDVSKIINKKLSAPTPFARAYLKATLSEIRLKDEYIQVSGESRAMANLVPLNGALTEQNMGPTSILRNILSAG